MPEHTDTISGTSGQRVEGLKFVEPTMAPPPIERTTPPADTAEVTQVFAAANQSAETQRRIEAGDRLGRFRLQSKLGEGGMGEVYRAIDEKDGTTAAVKVLRSDWASQPDALRRFHKEARILAEVDNPYVARLLEVSEDNGVVYLAMEFVDGQTVHEVLKKSGKLSEPDALAILADMARALKEAHERGIIHRDIKPANVMLLGEPPARRVKLLDFGLARHVIQSESLHLTRTGATMGTPLYMAPEQCLGKKELGPPTDVYALGAVLFHLLAGRPPFQGEEPLATCLMHCSDPVPPLRDFNPTVSDGVCQVVEKALAKAPEARYSHAGEMLRDLERLRRGEPTGIAVHPRTPVADPKNVLCYVWTWELQSSPAQLWPYVAHTERINRAAGLSAVEFSTEPNPRGGARRFARLRKPGLNLAWEEHPFEWVEERRFGVLREFSQGPFKWFISQVELEPRGSGTRLTQRLTLEPRNWFGKLAAAIEVGIRARRAFERLYLRIDGVLAGKLNDRAAVDPFEEPAHLSAAQRRRLDGLLNKLMERGFDPILVERLGSFLAQAPDQEAARIRPLALARRLGVDPDQVVAACLHGAHEGLLVMLWDILCPVCRIPSETRDSLKQLREHGRCDVCNLNFELDFANAVEMIFRVHPEVRSSDLRTYCVGGPGHSPHVAAQVRVAPGENFVLNLALAEGAYRLRGPQLPFIFDFQTQQTAETAQLDIDLTRGPACDAPKALLAGRQVITLTNDLPQELLVKVERTAARTDALTAGRATLLALFRQLFPGEILSPGQLVNVAALTLLAVDLDQARDPYEELGDVPAFQVLHDYFRLLEEAVRREGGTLVKTMGEVALAAFPQAAPAVRVALDLPGLLARNDKTRGLRIRAGLNRGTVLAATLNERIDYFGVTVKRTAKLAAQARGGQVLLSDTVAGDLAVDALLRQRGLQGEPAPDGATMLSV